jgi:uncharacterized Zn finger protein
MKCPVCRNSHNHSELDVHTNGFDEEIIHCDICGTIWAVNHGLTEIVRDAQDKSFLSASSECVEADDYGLVA